MRPGGHYPSPGLIIAGCLTIVAAGCTVALSAILTALH